jgi:hypothetical protein
MDSVRHTRRLSDKILWAFDHAIDTRQVDIAGVLMRALELALTSEGGAAGIDKRKDFEQVTLAYERLRHEHHQADPAEPDPFRREPGVSAA